jgi:hypothetical protein
MGKEKPVLLEFKKYRIVKFDDRNLQIQEFKDFKQKDGNVDKRWDTKAESYYGSMRGALGGLAKKKLMSAEIRSVETLIEMIDSLNNRIDKLELKGV